MNLTLSEKPQEPLKDNLEKYVARMHAQRGTRKNTRGGRGN